MAIRRSFAGSTIRKPGAYSEFKETQDSGVALESNDTLFLFGEADAGPGGAEEGIQTFSAQGFSRLVAKYRSGPLVDSARAALSPSRTPGVNGAGVVKLYKTNPSTQAELVLGSSYGTVASREYGVGANRITYKSSLSAETEALHTGSAAVTNFAGLDTLTLEVQIDGAAKQTVTFAAPADITAVLTQINGALTGVTATEDSGILTLTQDVGTDLHQNGFGRSFEILASSTALGDLFLSAGLYVPADEPEAAITVVQPRDGITNEVSLGGEIALFIGRDTSDSATAATVTVSDTQLDLTATGSSSYTLLFEDYPLLSQLVEAIDALPGWSATVPATLANLPSTALDNVTGVAAFSEGALEPARIKIDAYRVGEFFADSTLVSISSASSAGLPDAQPQVNLAGAIRGASSSLAFSAALDAVLGEEVNVILPAVSQDASEDILAGKTDPASSYDIESIHALLAAHLNLRGNVQNRKEAQGMVGYRKALKSEVFAQSAGLGEYQIQLFFNDVLVLNSSAELVWQQPHVEAALNAGIRLGTSVGEPLTHKFLALSGYGHFVDPVTGVIEGDFDPLIDFDAAIEAGATFAEPAQGGFRVAIDNTTYGIDQSFVFNRGSVIEASQFTFKTIRREAELSFVGRKNATVTASAIKSRLRAVLVELFNDEVLSPSVDAPQGFVEESFIVEVTGNTARVEVEIKPVQGLDFFLISFTLGETRQSA